MKESPVTERGVSRRSSRRSGALAVWVGLGVLSILAVEAIHARIPPSRDLLRGEAFVPEPGLARLLSMGFGAAVADFYWLGAIQAVAGDARMTPELGEYLGRVIDVVTTLDPWVDHPYRFAAIWLTESEENVRTANRLLERGIEYHPDDWRNYFYLGFNHFFYLLENEEAADALVKASVKPGAPRYLPRLAARLRSESADIEVAATFLRELLRSGEDEAAKEGYRTALDEIEVEQNARILERARTLFRERNGRDIEGVIELVGGVSPVLDSLPSAEPSALPPGLRRGSQWQLEPESGRIVSTYYGKRYQLHMGVSDRARAENWAREGEAGERTVGGGDGNPRSQGGDRDHVR
ncbi:MAG: hypothetical protein NZ990_10615 [Myxococcota bacterium]|nr:hypothetical protein [Myxococcota bacterium]